MSILLQMNLNMNCVQCNTSWLSCSTGLRYN